MKQKVAESREFLLRMSVQETGDGYLYTLIKKRGNTRMSV